MDEHIGKEEQKEHLCTEHVRYDGGQKINRDGVRVWVETYFCALCGNKLDVKEEILD